MAGGDAQAHLVRQFGDGQPPVLLKQRKDLTVYGIHMVYYST
jgi:hypothetical protein